ncbi:MAG TPA: hydroxyisourate hydrolase [Polyangiaceae bacterium]|jgi:5-hydroxyisourate hydrolase
MGISTHVLDTAKGAPAKGVRITLERAVGEAQWELVSDSETDIDGRVKTLVPADFALTPNSYRLRFDTHAYARKNHFECFFPEVSIVFDVKDSSQHYHVPLLLSPFGYSTYRGS